MRPFWLQASAKVEMCGSPVMTKTIVLASALLIGGAAFGASGEMALAAQAKDAVATKTQCERDATLHNYVGKP